MAITLLSIPFAQSSNTASVTTAAVDTTGANLIVIGISCNQQVTVSDSKSNAWVPLTDRTTAVPATRMYYCSNPTVGSGHTFTASFTGQEYPSIAALVFSGAASSSPFDVENGFSGTLGTSHNTGSVTPSEDNEVIVACLTNLDATADGAINSGFTIADSGGYDGVNHYSLYMAYLIQTSAAAVNPTWSNLEGGDGSTAIACFKAAVGGGGSAVGAGLVGGRLLSRGGLVSISGEPFMRRRGPVADVRSRLPLIHDRRLAA